MLIPKIFEIFACEPAASKLRSFYLTVKFRAQVIVSTLGATRLYRELADFPAPNTSSARLDKVVVSPCPHRPRHDAEGRSVAPNIRQVTTSGPEVHMEEISEAGNIV